MSASKPPGRPPTVDDPFGRWFPDDQSQPTSDWLIGRVIGGVLIQRCIGQGGMGRVYMGLSRDRGHAVAVKVIEPGLANLKEIEALRREAQILGLFDHPCIAPVYAAGTHVIDGREVPFLVMKLIRGARGIVEYAIQERLNSKQRVKLFEKVCAAVGHGHGKSIVHRDLKPSNILVDASGNPFVIDFGVARSLNPELTRLAVRDRTGEIPGTYAYMSPEQFAGNPDAVDKRTDVYSLGMILYELLAGKLPYDIENKNGGEISRIVQFDPPVPIERRRPDLKPAVTRITRKCLEKRPRDRFPDAVALLSAVKGKLRNEPVLVKAGRRLRGLARFAARHRSLLAGVALGAFLALIGERVIWSITRLPAEEPKAAASMDGQPRASVPAKPRAAEERPVGAGSAPDAAKVAPVKRQLLQASVVEPPGVNEAGAAAVPAAPMLLDTKSEPVDEQEIPGDRALRWLSEHQLEDGSWSFKLNDCPRCAGKCGHSGKVDDRAGATALALLPFLGRGYTHREGPYKKQVGRGVAFLAARSVAGQGKVYNAEGSLYSQALAGIALSECYGMTQDNRLAMPTRLALDCVMKSQDERGGGWRNRPDQPANVMTMGWQIMSLVSGKFAYPQIDPLTVAKATVFLDSVQVDGGFRYHGDQQRQGDDPRSTAVALLCRMYLGWKRDNLMLQEGVRYLSEIGPTKDLTYDFYATEVMHHMEGDTWILWNTKMKSMLLKAQSINDHEAGSWCEGFEDSEEARAGGRLHCTATAALILETYYRSLPLYRNTSVDEEFKE